MTYPDRSVKALVLAVLLVACGTTPGSEIPTNPYQELTVWRGVVEEIVLTDGTPCAVARSQQAIGISCDWTAR